jgi:hypothetical protein
MRIPCADLSFAREVWIANDRNLVGFIPRIHIRKGSSFEYRCWWKVWWTGSYSIILTKAAFLHHKYFVLYTDNMPSIIKKFVDDHRNCEDIAMQFLISNSTGLPPVYVKGNLEDKGALNGISTSQNVFKADHMRERDNCLNELIRFYGKNPLQLSRWFALSAKSKWKFTASTWYEYISSDLWKS